jgi:hypothetical protein
MNAEVKQQEVGKQAKQEDKPNRHEFARQQVSHQGLRTTGIAAGLLALVGLSAWLLA